VTANDDVPNKDPVIVPLDTLRSPTISTPDALMVTIFVYG
jgi:hypothetical protein